MTGMIANRRIDRLVYDGHVKVVQRELVFMTPDDTYKVQRDVVQVPDVVVIVPEVDGLMLAINQYRAPLNRWITEFPAGGIDEGETPLQAAKRELAEEVDLQSDDWVELGKFSSSEGYSTEQATLFLAKNCQPHKGEYERVDEEKWASTLFVDYIDNDNRFTGAKGHLAYELARQELLGAH